MPPEASQRLTASRSFDRVEGESPQSYGAFVLYRNMGPDRTLDRVSNELSKSTALIRKWSSEWNWRERCETWDRLIEVRAREVAEGYLPIWEQRRQVSLERLMLFSSKLFAKAEAMLDHPIVKEITRESADGRTIFHIVEPCSWTWGSLATMIKTAAELQASVISEGLAESADEAFDVESASPEELRAFIEKTRKRGK